jgi:N-hydroxyarylamine O-acetyltransferase
MSDAIDIAAYRRRIGFADAIEPTPACLARLIEHHAAAIPFENIEVLAGRVPALDDAALQAKMIQRRRGGYCFEQNKLFRGVLQASGFTARPLEARIRAGVAADVVTGRTHLVNCVTLAGVAHLVDVGCGGIAPLAPLPLGSRAEHDAGTGRYRFVDQDDDLLLQTATHEGWADCYRVVPGGPQQIDCELANWFVATHPNSLLRHNLLAARAIDGGRLRLFNDRLSTYRPESAAPHEQVLGTRREFADAFADGFGLAVADADLDAVLGVLERQQAVQPR